MDFPEPSAYLRNSNSIAVIDVLIHRVFSYDSKEHLNSTFIPQRLFTSQATISNHLDLFDQRSQKYPFPL